MDGWGGGWGCKGQLTGFTANVAQPYRRSSVGKRADVGAGVQWQCGFLFGRPSIRGCFAYGLDLCLRWRCFLRLLLFCTCPVANARLGLA